MIEKTRLQKIFSNREMNFEITDELVAHEYFLSRTYAAISPRSNAPYIHVERAPKVECISTS